MSLVPMNKRYRDRVLRDAGIHDWYRAAGYTVEPDEYVVEPERKGYEVVDGVPRVSRVVPLDPAFDQETELDFSDDDLTEDESGLLAIVTEVSGLTKGEQKVTAWVLDGNNVQASGYLDRMAESLNVTSNAAEVAWRKARNKLRDRWRVEPRARRYLRPVASLEGQGLYPWGGDVVSWPGTYPRA